MLKCRHVWSLIILLLLFIRRIIIYVVLHRDKVQTIDNFREI